ncbi:MAG: hypothetical protein CSB47_06085 [Proteobacteria bacterium]|nr:MAG: hypothetical protein CSB47_06085 [Pseudomonadota bacterium]
MKTIFNRASGFTLIEALVTISIAAILASIAIPSFSKMIQDNRVSTASNDFLSALMLARSEAVKRSMSVSICTSSDGATCSNTLKDYARGWIIFTDCGGDKKVTTAATTCDLDGDGTNDPDKILRVEQGLKGVFIKSTANKKAFTYQFSGRASNTSFDIGPKGQSATRKINVAITGRARLKKL